MEVLDGPCVKDIVMAVECASVIFEVACVIHPL